jgi:hypothetical protein
MDYYEIKLFHRKKSKHFFYLIFLSSKAEIERLTYELERSHNSYTKHSAALDAVQEEAARYSLELEKMRERYVKTYFISFTSFTKKIFFCFCTI